MCIPKDDNFLDKAFRKNVTAMEHDHGKKASGLSKTSQTKKEKYEVWRKEGQQWKVSSSIDRLTTALNLKEHWFIGALPSVKKEIEKDHALYLHRIGLSIK